MNAKRLARWFCLGAMVSQAWAQTTNTTPEPTGLDGQLFYQLLLGEMRVKSGDAGAGFSLVLDAARRLSSEALFQRATEIALQSRNADAALQATRSWARLFPGSRDANRNQLQILLATNQLEGVATALRAELKAGTDQQRVQLLNALPRSFARITDKALAAKVVEDALTAELARADTGPLAWATVGRMRAQAADLDGAMDAAKRGQALDTTAEPPALLALELMDPKRPQAEGMVRALLQLRDAPGLRLAFSRELIDQQRHAEALLELKKVTASSPENPDAWLVQGLLLVQEQAMADAETALQRYLTLVSVAPTPNPGSGTGMAQAHLAMAQIAESRKDFAAAEAWLSRIDPGQDLLGLQSRRASVLARQGRVDEARRLIQSVPSRNDKDVKDRLAAEARLLRDIKDFNQAYQLMQQASAQDDKDTDLVYDLAMLAEKTERLDEMERLLRKLIELKPDHHHAYNALGYSLADRNIRLDEAKSLILKALSFAPNDPFISDSLGWVEFRLGNVPNAQRILEQAFQTRPDAEIGAHLGEVLWVSGQREKALAIWRNALKLGPDNETLRATLKCLDASP